MYYLEVAGWAIKEAAELLKGGGFPILVDGGITPCCGPMNGPPGPGFRAQAG